MPVGRNGQGATKQSYPSFCEISGHRLGNDISDKESFVPPSVSADAR